MQELKLLLLNITYERKLDCRITDEEALDADRIIIPFLGGINGKFYVISFVVIKNKQTKTKPCQLSWWLFSSYDEVILEVIVSFGVKIWRKRTLWKFYYVKKFLS